MELLTPPSASPCLKSLPPSLPPKSSPLNSPVTMRIPNKPPITQQNDSSISSKCTKKPERPIIKRNQKNTKKPAFSTTCTTSDVLRLMDALCLKVPLDIYYSFIKECTVNKDSHRAVELYNHINRSGINLNLPLLNRILIMYVACGCFENARRLFDEMRRKNFHSWAVMVIGCVEEGEYEEVLELFAEMLEGKEVLLGFPGWFLVCVLKACVYTENLEVGKQVHGWLLKLGYTEEACVSSCLIDFYGKLRCLQGAYAVFAQVSDRSSVIWTSKIVNESRKGSFVEVIEDFKEMGRVGVEKNRFTLSSVLRACARLKDNGLCGQQVHGNAIKLGLELDSYVQCTLVDMYGKCGMLGDARKVFGMARDKKNVACWNAMVSSYIRQGLFVEAIKIVYQMKTAKIEPRESLINDLKIACGTNTGLAINLGQDT